jgi:hypothetical protein
MATTLFAAGDFEEISDSEWGKELHESMTRKNEMTLTPLIFFNLFFNPLIFLILRTTYANPIINV